MRGSLEHAERTYAELIYEMENCVKLDVPFVEEYFLDSWDAMKGVPDYLQDVFSPVDTSFQPIYTL
jgi:effector-binding domain-containing protein